MGFDYDGTGIEPQGGGYPVIPQGPYDLEITEVEDTRAKSSNRRMVVVNYMVIDSLEHNGKFVRYHNVTFMGRGEKGAGMTLHFLKCIGEPYKDKFKVRPENWVGKKLRAFVKVAEYKGRQKNEVSDIQVYEGSENASAKEETPF